VNRSACTKLVGGARAAVSLTALVAEVHLVHDLEERGLGGGGLRGVGVSLVHGVLGVGLVALAALGTLLASRLLALELALGLGAVGGLDALVVALELLAHGRALGFGGGAGGVALGGGADGLALGARLLLAGLLGATDRAGRLLAVDGALGARGLLALHLADGALADGVAHSGAAGVVTLPLAVGVALIGADSDDGQKKGDGNKELHLEYLESLQ